MVKAVEDPALEELLDDAAGRLDAGDAEGALAGAEEACARAPRLPAALQLRAAALTALGRLTEARGAWAAAVEAGGRDVDVLLGAADFHLYRADGGESDGEPAREDLEQALALARRGRSQARKQDDADGAADLAFLEGVALAQLGSPREALACFEAVLAHDPEDLDAQLEQGLALFELCRWDEARRVLTAVVREDPRAASAHHALGLIAERRGDAAAAARHLARARKLAPDDFPRPVSLAPEAFDRAVEDALAALPEPVRRYLSNVAITVEDVPSEEDLAGSDPPLSPSILGLFRGAPLGDKASMDPWSHFPSSIALYQRNLERFARDRDELVEEIGITLLHEVGHFLGLDEEELRERGLD